MLAAFLVAVWFVCGMVGMHLFLEIDEDGLDCTKDVWLIASGPFLLGFVLFILVLLGVEAAKSKD